MNIKEIIKRIEERYDAHYTNLVISHKGINDTDGQSDAIHFQNRAQLKGAKKMIILLSTSRTLRKILGKEEEKVKKDESE